MIHPVGRRATPASAARPERPLCIGSVLPHCVLAPPGVATNAGGASLKEVWTALARAREILARGGIVVIPTETVYGLAARIDREDAVRRVFEVKQRPLFDPLIVHVSGPEQARGVTAAWPAVAQRLAERFWPGPLTLVLPRAPGVNPLITAGLDTVAVRCPKHPLARRLVRTVGAPLAAPSANRFGATSPTTAEHVRAEFEREDLFILDGGPCDVGIESTVVEVVEESRRDALRILRPGAVTRDDLALALAGSSRAWTNERAQSAKSPGHTAQHYPPAIPLVIVSTPTRHGEPVPPGAIDEARRRLEKPGGAWVELRLEPAPALAARTLYASMRSLAASGAAFMVVRRDAQRRVGQWDAIWDRLERAASLTL